MHIFVSSPIGTSKYFIWDCNHNMSVVKLIASLPFLAWVVLSIIAQGLLWGLGFMQGWHWCFKKHWDNVYCQFPLPYREAKNISVLKSVCVSGIPNNVANNCKVIFLSKKAAQWFWNAFRENLKPMQCKHSRIDSSLLLLYLDQYCANSKGKSPDHPHHQPWWLKQIACVLQTLQIEVLVN